MIRQSTSQKPFRARVAGRVRSQISSVGIATLGMLRIAGIRRCKPWGAHIDFRAHAEPGRQLAINIENDPLSLPEHAENRTVKSISGEFVFGEVRIAKKRSVTGDRVVGLHDPLKRHRH